MPKIYAQSAQAKQALKLVTELQNRFVTKLETASTALKLPQKFQAVEWQRDEGTHGGGIRFETADGLMIGRGSVNVSQVHYDENPDKKLGSATAISTIIHPNHPLAPSVHIHISWTEMKSGHGYWRMMADLNPANEDPKATALFLSTLQQAAPKQFDEAKAQGERYFYIPALKRHRGVAHFYLESYATDNAEDDFNLAQSVGETAIDTYVNILQASLTDAREATATEIQAQSDYHTLYFFQVLTLDRGTTTGLLVHNQNDVGILGSLPAMLDKTLLQSWKERLETPQDLLLQSLLDALPNSPHVRIDEAAKAKLAQAVRVFYQQYPDAINMQASGHITPPTVKNHS
ncbi:MAG: coproporphyrinogen III oxidase [Zetaproteobacteria bacterium CG2_30_46_52]|nr:MAG: coproporphyrinogen III oxidase [Zetaproteobacteria bacterium CG2_30_46_52]